jgi:diguanylate cyclase (GGDEF)-like protein
MIGMRDVSGAARAWARVGVVVSVLLVAAQFVTSLPAVGSRLGAGWWGAEALQDSVYVLATVLVLTRSVLVRRDRFGWLLMALALGMWAVGTVYWAAVVAKMDPMPFPSPADAMWLAYYPFAYGAVLRLLRTRVSAGGAASWLDGLIASACAAAFASLVFLAALAGQGGGSTLATVVTVAYPAADIVLAGCVLGAWALSGWRTERMWMLLLAGMAINTTANGIYLLKTVHGSYVAGTWTDSLWSVGVLVIMMAAWQGEAGVRERRPTRAWVAVALPAVLGCASTALLLYGSWRYPGLPRVSGVLAAVAITAAVVRMLLTVRAVESLADARRQARTDDLTGLPNRRLFLERLDSELRNGGADRSLAVALVDLDRFKEINDSFGHHLGDELLQLVARRLHTTLGDTGLLARLGGDEFGLLLPAAEVDQARDLAAAVLSELRRPFGLTEATLHVDASIGIAVFPQHGVDRATLLRHADTAMYAAKAVHSGFQVATGNPDDDAGRRRLATLEELRAGLDRGELVLHYQPQLDLATGRVPGVEALVRWNHPSRGMVYPDGFLPIAEHAGLMGRLTLQVLELALSQARAWADQGLDLTVAVNLSASNLQDTDLPLWVADALLRHQVPAAALHLEITEEVLMRDAARATEVLAALRQMGIRLAVDDYGTGYSSLAYLHALPVDDLKLDRAFVAHCDTDPRSAAIVESTVDLAHNLGMRMIAEGVENETVLDRLRHWDCDLAQGYHLARPQPPDRLTAWLHQRHQPAASHPDPTALLRTAS